LAGQWRLSADLLERLARATVADLDKGKIS
jgi:hypothetical protein